MPQYLYSVLYSFSFDSTLLMSVSFNDFKPVGVGVVDWLTQWEVGIKVAWIAESEVMVRLKRVLQYSEIIL